MEGSFINLTGINSIFKKSVSLNNTNNNMFEKSKSAITFKEFQDTLNVINNFDNEWGHFYDPENNNNVNNIIQNNFYQYKKEPIKIKIKEKEPKKLRIIKNVFNYTIIISILFYIIYKLSETGKRGGL